MKQKSVLLLGSYGQSNLGDDLLMWNYLELLRERGFTEIYVNANSTELIPRPVRKAYPDLQIIDTYNTSLIDYIRFIRRVDCIVYGGGTLYKELYVSTGRSRYSVIIRMMGFNCIAKLLGAKLYHLNIGIGSLKTWLGRSITKLALASATQSVFRDQPSYDLAKNTLRIDEKKIDVSTDGLFLQRRWETPWHEAGLHIDRKKHARVVGVNVLSDIPDWIDRDHYIQVIRTFVRKLLDEGSYVVFLPFQYAFNPRNDLLFIKETFKDVLQDHANYTIVEKLSIDTVSSYLRQCDVFIGMRFHSLLLSGVNNVPFVAIAYDTKCSRFVKETEYPHAVELESLSLGNLTETYENALASKAKTKRQLKKITKHLYDEAREGIRRLHL